MTTKTFTAFLFVSILLLGVTGCGPGGPPVQLVEGTVSIDGELLENCTVTLMPKNVSGSTTDLTQPLPASGVTDEKGFYRLTAEQGGAFSGGTTVGEYAVCIVRKTMTPPGPGEKAQRGKIRPVFFYYTPELYEYQDDTPIIVTVKKGKNRFDFDLKSDGSSYTVNGESFTVSR